MQKIKLAFAIFVVSLASNTSANDVLEELDLLKKQLALLQSKIIKLEKTVEKPKKSSNEPAKLVTNVIESKSKTKKDIKLYASLRPTLGYFDENNNTSSDVKDALSNAGFKSNYNFKKNWTATLHGEWGIDLSDSANFGKARQVYVAVDSPYGKVAIGKQRPVQYLFIAEYNDIFDHSNSPFAYDVESPFFVDNMVTYQLKTGDFTWMLASQFNGDEGDNYSDFFNGGMSYDIKNLHLAATYLEQSVYESGINLGDDSVYSGSIAYTFDNDLYLAIAYQSKDYERKNLVERSGHTFDIAMGYSLTNDYKLKAGYFAFEDGKLDSITKDHNGGNITLEWLPNEDVKFHIEYLHRNFEQLPDFNSISIGFRYDYAQYWKF